MTEALAVRNGAARTAALLTAVLAAGSASAGDLFVKPAGSGSTCVQAAPCTLATALATAAAGDTIYLGAGTYTGSGEQVVRLDKAVNLLGGWDGASSGPVKRDHVVYTSTLNGENARRVITITGAGVTPTIDGLTITGGNATGWTAGCGPRGSATGCGGGILVRDAGPVISNNQIGGNVAARVSSDPNDVAAGGGVSVAYGNGAVIRDNTFSNNTASTASQGFGGAIALEYCTDCRIEGNRIVGNTACALANQLGYGGGIAVTGGSGATVVERNLVRDNTAAITGIWAFGSSLYGWQANHAVAGNLLASKAGGDVVLDNYSKGSITANLVEAGGEAESALFLFAGGGQEVQVTNNVLVGGAQATVALAGSSAFPLAAALKHNTIVGNGAATGVRADDFATVTLTNTIVTGHVTGLTTAGSGALAAGHTLFWMNDDDGIRGSDPVDGDPRFVNRAFGDFHVYEGSAAQGRGADAGVPGDIDGDARPGLGGVDIGADEIAPYLFDFGTPSSPVAAGHTQVAPATAYAPALGFGWTSGTIAARDRQQPDDLRRDFCFTPRGTFAVDVPNGRFRVTATVGDQTTAHNQMGFSMEGQQVASVTTTAGQFLDVTRDVSVTDGQLTLELQDLGGGDPNVVINALIVLRMPGIGLDLGTAGSPVQGGWTRITPASLFTPAAGAGWQGGLVDARDRGVGSALLRDFNFTRMAYFYMFLQDNVYDLSLTYGDATTAHDNMAVALQAQGAGSLSTAANQFVTRTYPACVVNNLLRIFLVDAGGKDPNVVLNAVQIRPRAHPSFDFGTATSPVAEGFQQVTQATAYEAWRGYGWTSGTLSSRDRGTGAALERDFVFATQAELAVDILDGVYDVDITMGDATVAHDNMAVTLEGQLVDTVSTVAGPPAARSYRVRVTGGQLNLGLADTGGHDPNVVINGLTIR